MSANRCPLCCAKFEYTEMLSNNELMLSTVGVVGVAQGKPSMSATCKNGCYVTAQSALTGDELYRRRNAELKAN